MAKRKITLLLRHVTDESKRKVMTWCKENNIMFYYRYQAKDYYYFTIYGSTTDYNNLQAYMNNVLIETDFAELGNLMDCYDEQLEKFEKLTYLYDAIDDKETSLMHQLTEFIKDIKDVNVLNKIRSYNFTHKCNNLIDDCISRAKGEPDSYERYLKNKEFDNKMFGSDFNTSMSDINGVWVKMDELHKMFEAGVLSVDRSKLEKYQKETRINK